MARLDWPAFGRAVTGRLDAAGLSVRGAVARWPETNIALWSRARSGRKPLSVENFLLVCHLLRLSPRAFWSRDKRRRVTRKMLAKQAVTVGVRRETSKGTPPCSGT